MRFFTALLSLIGIALAAAVAPVAAAATPAPASALVLAKRGQTASYTIVRPASASPSQIYAAEELQHFTEKMTGVKLPIVTDAAPLPTHAILLGETRHNTALVGSDNRIGTDTGIGTSTRTGTRGSFGEDGFRIVARPPHLLVVGSAKRGTLYGVYELLERFGGCRWYASWHSVIPIRDTFAVPATFDETQKPAFALREPFWFDMFNGDLAARNKVNGNRATLTERHGGHSHRFGGGLGSCHTFNQLLSPEKYFDAHPEYFSEIKGRRVKKRTQLCLTNPDVLRIVTANVLERIRKDPGADFYGVSQNDWYNFCECANCKAVDDREGSHAGTMIEFVNKIAEAVEKEFPNVTIETLAYQYTRKPPKNVRPRHNVMPCLCTIECDFSLPLDISTFAENRKFVSDIRGWHAISKRLYLWDYTTNFRFYTSPSPNVLTLQANVKFFRANGVDYLFEQGAYQGRHGDFAELKAWLLSKWLWNPDLPVEPLLNDFFTGYYGAAAPLVRRYFDELHTFHRAAVKPWRIYDSITDPVIPDAFIEKSISLWQQAENAVKDSPAHSYNVRMAALPVLQSRLARLSARKKNPAEQRALATTLLARFAEAKNIRLREGNDNSILAAWRASAKLPPPAR
ncbi:MAG: DUF4838 domain-containing protein [Puniceicoccales bacterium]|jgi:hypothetical protein|nr:DUF4838 domain-containing protein [Puniceicoccales bacterium]